MTFNYNDGGRAALGLRGQTGDCVCRAICIATGRPYREVYSRLAQGNRGQRRSRGMKGSYPLSASEGICTTRKWFKDYMRELGFQWVATMGMGTGCRVHLRAGELPATGRLIVSLSRHMTTVIDGVINDTYNPDRGGWRCVYGYYILKIV